MKHDLKDLEITNYIVETSEEHYYLLCGIRSLWRFSKAEQVNFKDLCTALLTKGYLLLEDGDTQISMI